MTDPIHDDEPDTGAAVVRALLTAQCSSWADLPAAPLATTGTDNALWRLTVDDGPDLVVRLPRRPAAAAAVSHELAALERVAALGVRLRTPRVRHVGEPHPTFPHPWSVLEWLPGTDAWTARDALDLDGLGRDLAEAVTRIGDLPTDGLRPREPGERGGPLAPLLTALEEWLTDPRWRAAELLDVAAVRRLADEARELADEPVELGAVHGDLIPGNLLVEDGRLCAVIDWGGAGLGDRAQDLAPAWSVLTSVQRPAFREAVGAEEATWLRARTCELEHAVGGVLYYRPRGHPLGEVMARTLERILRDV